MNNLGITLPINLVPTDAFPKSVAVGDNRIVFFHGNVTYIHFRETINNSYYLEVGLITCESFCLEERAEIRSFLSQFPEEIFKKADKLHSLYIALMNPF